MPERRNRPRASRGPTVCHLPPLLLRPTRDPDQSPDQRPVPPNSSTILLPFYPSGYRVLTKYGNNHGRRLNQVNVSGLEIKLDVFPKRMSKALWLGQKDVSILNDPDFILLDTLFVTLCDKPKESLSADEAILVNIWHTMGLIENGGLHDFLCATDINLDELLMDYRNINVPNASEPLEEAVLTFRQWLKKTNPSDPDPEEFRKQHGELLDRAEDRFYAAELEIIRALAQLVASRQIGATNATA